MKFSKPALDVLKHLEGLRLEAYQCAADVWTIGYGHVLTPGDPRKITEFEAAVLLKGDLHRFTDAVATFCEKGGRIPTPQQFDAMVCLAFNIGEEGFERSSVLRRFLNHDDAGAAAAFLLWNKVRRYDEETNKRLLRPSRALDARRSAESRMFLLGYYDQTPYNSKDDDAELLALKMTRNRSRGDDNVAAGDSEIRPTLKTSRTVKQTTIGTTGAAVTGTAAAAGGLSELTDRAKASAEDVRDIVDTTGGAVESAGEVVQSATETFGFMAQLPVLIWGLAVGGAVVSIISFILVRRARKDDWQRGRR